GQRAGLGWEHDDRRVRPEGRRGRGDEIGDAGPILGDAHALAARYARIAVGHVAGALLVHGGNEADAGRRKQVESIHVGGADNTKHMGDAMGEEGFNEGFAWRHPWHFTLPAAYTR